MPPPGPRQRTRLLLPQRSTSRSSGDSQAPEASKFSYPPESRKALVLQRSGNLFSKRDHQFLASYSRVQEAFRGLGWLGNGLGARDETSRLASSFLGIRVFSTSASQTRSYLQVPHLLWIEHVDLSKQRHNSLPTIGCPSETKGWSPEHRAQMEW